MVLESLRSWFFESVLLDVDWLLDDVMVKLAFDALESGVVYVFRTWCVSDVHRHISIVVPQCVFFGHTSHTQDFSYGLGCFSGHPVPFCF